MSWFNFRLLNFSSFIISINTPRQISIPAFFLTKTIPFLRWYKRIVEINCTDLAQDLVINHSSAGNIVYKWSISTNPNVPLRIIKRFWRDLTFISYLHSPVIELKIYIYFSSFVHLLESKIDRRVTIIHNNNSFALLQSYKLIFLDEMKFILDSRQARSANSLARLLEREERGKGKRWWRGASRRGGAALG